MAVEIVGRGTEIDATERFLSAAGHGPAALLLQGEAGIGKTTLWQFTLDSAEGSSYRLMSCRPVESEARLSYASLSDLLAQTSLDPFSLPEPQRRALEVALLRAEPEGPRPDHRAVGTAFLSVVTQMAESEPVLVAVDDVQWLDGPSSRALEFAIRRLRAEPAGMLISMRTGSGTVVPLGLDRAFDDERLHTVSLGPLSLAALGRIIKARLGRMPSRPILAAIERASEGNPFFALELARALVRSGKPLVPGESLPIPDTLRELISRRIGALSPTTRETLAVASVLSERRREVIASMMAAEDIGEALVEAEQADVIRVMDGVAATGAPRAKGRRDHGTGAGTRRGNVASGKVRRYGDDYGAACELFDRALAEVGNDGRLRACVERDMAIASIVRGDVQAGITHARSAVESAERVGDPASWGRVSLRSHSWSSAPAAVYGRICWSE